MQFNSIEFGVFLIIVFLMYWFVLIKNLRLRNVFILIASYVFYGWWDWRFLSLIFISSITDYVLGLKLYATENERIRKLLLGASLLVNIGILGFFKYYGFFVDTFNNAFRGFGIALDTSSLQLILPIGISFYTFQTLSYTIDIYRKQLEPTKDIIQFFAFVSFFPQLVAGPIERARNLLPQFKEKKDFEYAQARDGLRQILWGLFKKIVVADTCAVHVDYIFANYNYLPASVLVLGAVYFAFQIYGDFSGYSDIAIGTARLFGFSLMRNFALPYFSRDIAEFWRRWHISLSTWFRDYLYIPLGGSYGNRMKHIANILITFTVSGFWHGANWTFIFWGFLNGVYYIPLILLNKQKAHTGIVAQESHFPSLHEMLNIGMTFSFILIAWIFFRAESVNHGVNYLKNIFSNSLFVLPMEEGRDFVIILAFVIIEWFQRKRQHCLQIEGWPVVARWFTYYILIYLILHYWAGEQEFIYFQF